MWPNDSKSGEIKSLLWEAPHCHWVVRGLMQFLPSTTAVKAADLKKEREGVKKGRVKMIFVYFKAFPGIAPSLGQAPLCSKEKSGRCGS